MRAVVHTVVAALILASFASSAHAQSRGSGWVAPPAPADAADELKTVVQETDALYAARDKAGNSDKILNRLRAAATQYPTSYAVQWRLARILFWLSEVTADKAQHRKLAEEGWEAGKKAIAANPEGAEGLYFKAICVGEVAHSVGILTALTKGIEGEFRDPLLKAEKLNPLTDHGGIFRALGRYKFELPWPRRDLDASVKYLKRALEVNKDDLRGRVYLAETLEARDGKGDIDEAKKLLKEVIDAPIGGYDAPEDHRAKQFARELVARLKWDIK